MSGFDKELMIRQLDNYQIQRHDFLNYFQVIRGYLQLNMPEKALVYLDEAIIGLRPQQEIQKIGQKTLLVILLSWYLDLKLCALETEIAFPPEMNEEEYWLCRWREEYAVEFYRYTKDCLNSIPKEKDPEDIMIKIELLSASNGFSCEFRLFKQEVLTFCHVFKTEGDSGE